MSTPKKSFERVPVNIVHISGLIKIHLLSQIQLKFFLAISTGTLSKLDIRALTLENFSVFFQKRTC